MIFDDVSSAYYSDIKSRKNVAQSARHRKNGSKSKKCSLPSDRMKRKEWEKMNGDVLSVRMDEKMTWEELKKLPMDLEIEYINGLQRRYGVTFADIARMMGVQQPSMCRRFRGSELKNLSDRSVRENKRREWDAFCDGVAAESVIEPEDNRDTLDDLGGEDAAEKRMRFAEFSLVFDGEIDVDAISNSIRRMIGQGAVGRIEIKAISDSGF